MMLNVTYFHEKNIIWIFKFCASFLNHIHFMARTMFNMILTHLWWKPYILVFKIKELFCDRSILDFLDWKSTRIPSNKNWYFIIINVPLQIFCVFSSIHSSKKNCTYYFWLLKSMKCFVIYINSFQILNVAMRHVGTLIV